MKKNKIFADVLSAKRRLQNAAAIEVGSNSRLQHSLLNARNLGELINLLNRDVAECLVDEIQGSIEQVTETRWQDCCEVKWTGKGAVREFHGHVSRIEMEESAIFMQQHPNFSSSSYAIHDFRKCTSLRVSDTDAFIMATRDAYVIKNKPNFRSAFVGNMLELKHIFNILKTVTNYTMPLALFENMENAKLFASSS